MELIRFQTEEELADAVASRWVEAVLKIPEKSRFCTALSGGRIAGRFFSELFSKVRTQPNVLSPVDFFWADERCVAPTDSESNYKLAYDSLLGPVGIDPGRIHRIQGELGKEAAAAAAEAEMRAVVPALASGQPSLDLVLLGMGEDGHIASLFPKDVSPCDPKGPVYRGVIGPKPPPARVTLDFAPLVAARDVWVLASGNGKQEALRTSLDPQGLTPLGKLLRLRTQTTVFTDITG